MANQPGLSDSEREVLKVLWDRGPGTVREINAEIRSAVGVGDTNILVKNPAARHNLGVAILKAANVKFDGSVGYYCGGLMDGPSLDIAGSAGWGIAESMLSGTVVVRASAGNGAAAAPFPALPRTTTVPDSIDSATPQPALPAMSSDGPSIRPPQ